MAVELLRANVTSFPSVEEAGDAFARTFSSFGKSKVLLLGDASHGTSEFYAARAELTKYMIEHHGFNIVAVEADWPDAEAIDRYVRHRPGPNAKSSRDQRPMAEVAGLEPAFMRFPTWMWRNQEVAGFVEWLRDYNRKYKSHEAVGFYGLDLYSLSTSMKAVIRYLDKVDPKEAEKARDRYKDLMRHAGEPHKYGLETLLSALPGYEAEVLEVLSDLLKKRIQYSSDRWDGDEFHSAEQNARLVKDAEHYYRAMYYARDESWNLRDTHMFETLVRVLKYRKTGPSKDGAKAIVWAHNSHVGDARATSMGWSRGELNLGQLCKEAFGARAANIGCGTYTGTVAAAHRWDGDVKVMRVRPGLPGSYEGLMHEVGIRNFCVNLRKGHGDAALRQALAKPRLERFIGVIYVPETERQSHYCQAILPEQFDGWIWLDETHPVDPMAVDQPKTAQAFDETWPFGL
ncbi:erythromycin esterase-domain-containing protein [Xylariomycetidae sp. FL2044]|nr:erythromycin esterase-domain-containing protein [Xylariomycetidae sp. FL2044]